MTQHPRAAAAAILLAITTITGCSAQAPGNSADPTVAATSPSASPSARAGMHDGPSTCPATAEVDDIPERVVTMDAGAAAILTELGVGDRIVGTAGPDFALDYDGEQREALDALKVIDPEGRGNAELVLAEKPDLVTGISVYEFGGFPGTPTVEVLESNGAAAVAACGTGDGSPVTDIQSTYDYITELARIFKVDEQGKELIATMQQYLDQLEVTPTDTQVLTLSGVPDAAKGIMTSGGVSFANGVIALAGGKNVAQTEMTDFAQLSTEAVATADPEVIVVVSGFSKVSDAELQKSIVSDPLLATTTAVKTGNVVVVPQRIMSSPSLLNVKAVEIIAAAVAKA